MSGTPINIDGSSPPPKSDKGTIASIFVGCAVVWMLVIATATYHQTEPLTGGGWRVYLCVNGINLLLLGLLIRAALRGAFSRASSCAALLLLLAIAIPLHSKGGLIIGVNNQTVAPVRVQITRPTAPTRIAHLTAQPAAVTHYRTAPGDYSEELDLEFVVGGRKLSATVRQLRKHHVMLTETGITLVEIR